MYDLFQLHTEASTGRMIPANWHYVRQGLQGNLERVQQYYRRSPMAVKSDHFLVRLLESIPIPRHLPVERFYDNIDGIWSLNLSMALKMTSSISTGHAFQGVFYGGCKEVLIAHTADFNPFEAEKNWKRLCPIRVLRHPKSDLVMNLPDGSTTSDEEGPCVIAINVPMLAVMYRCFHLHEQYLMDLYAETPLTIMQFIHMYVLPNMLASHLDYALFNRLRNLAANLPQGVSKKKHPFVMPNFEDKLDAVQKTNLSNLKDVTKSFYDTLVNIPAVTVPDMSYVMRTPGMAPTRQVIWALGLSRFPMIQFLLMESLQSGRAKNGQEVNRVRQTLRHYQADNTFQTVLGNREGMDVKYELGTIATLVEMTREITDPRLKPA